MKKVTIIKPDFDDLVYPAIALAVHGETVAELRMCDTVLKKLEAYASRGKPQDRSTFEPGQTKAAPALFELRGVSAEFDFEDAEAEYVAEKLLGLLPQIQGRRARALLPIVEALQADDKAK